MTTSGNGLDPGLDLAQISALLMRIELHAEAEHLRQRIRIAIVKDQHGLLSEEEHDDLVLEGAALLHDADLWRTYK